MGILNYLPSFKIVEPNRLTGLVKGHVLSQFPLDPASTFIKSVGTPAINVVENGFIVGLANDLLVKAYDAATQAHPFLVFTEELNTFMNGLKYYATEEDADGDIYPRAVALYVGDAFTTDNYDKGAAKDPIAAKVVDGVLTLQDAADADSLFAVEDSTTPLGEVAYKFIYVGQTVAGLQ